MSVISCTLKSNSYFFESAGYKECLRENSENLLKHPLSCDEAFTRVNSLVNQFCLLDNEMVFNYIFCGVTMSFMLMACMMYRRTHYVKRSIIQSKKPESQETYCALSMHIVYSIQMLLRMTIPLLLIISVCFIIDTKYGEILFPKDYSSCDDETKTKDSPFIKIYLYMVWLKDAVSHIVVF